MTLRLDSAPIKARFDEAGYLRDEPVVARTGVLVYRNADGTERRELRLAKDVFDPQSLESYNGQAITIGHSAMVNSRNFRKHGVGTVLGDGRQDGEGVRAPIIVQDERAVEQARTRRLDQLSVGYNVDYIPRSGWYNTETGEADFDDERNDAEKGTQEFIGKEWIRFDGVQTNIRVNHVALVRKGRAGAIARLNLDGDEEIDYNQQDFISNEGESMKTIRIDGADVEVTADVAKHVESLNTQLNAEKTRADEAVNAKTTLEVANATLTQQVAEFPAQLEQARADSAAAVKSRGELEANAAKFGLKDFSADSDIDLKKKVIGVTSKINLDGKDDAYIDIAYDMAINSNSGMATQRQTVFGQTSRNDGAESGGSASEARQNMINKQTKQGGK